MNSPMRLAATPVMLSAKGSRHRVLSEPVAASSGGTADLISCGVDLWEEAVVYSLQLIQISHLREPNTRS